METNEFLRLLILAPLILSILQVFFPVRGSSSSKSEPPPSNPSDTINTSVTNDTAGNPIFRTVTSGTKTSIFTPSGIYKGYYDSKTNRTYDTAGNPVAQGNVLATLI